MIFEVGEKIGFYAMKGHGIILRVLSLHSYLVKDSDGFERTVDKSEIIKIYSEDYDANLKYVDKETTGKRSKKLQYFEKNAKGSEGNGRQKIWEIDLHIEHILSEYRHLSNTEILLKQMTEFKSFYQRALAQRVHKIIVIHGVGEGVLKNEIRTYLSKKENIEYYDASYLDYGKGATEVYFYKNQ